VVNRCADLRFLGCGEQETWRPRPAPMLWVSGPSATSPAAEPRRMPRKSQTKSQRSQTSGDAHRQSATISAGKQTVRQRPATQKHVKSLVCIQKARGSSPLSSTPGQKLVRSPERLLVILVQQQNAAMGQAAPLRGAGPGVSAALCLGRPARCTPGDHEQVSADQSGSPGALLVLAGSSPLGLSRRRTARPGGSAARRGRSASATLDRVSNG
jgi:hypothetical protein